MIEKLYIIIVGLFILGAILMAIINRTNPRVNKKQNWIKYAVYFLIVNIVLSCAAFYSEAFIVISIAIMAGGMYELVNNTYRTQKMKLGLLSLFIFLILSFTLVEFSFLPKEWLIYSVFVVFIFDSFSQIVGQLVGRTKITKISPNKTLEGMIGGFFFGTLSAVLLRNEVNISLTDAIIIGFGISLFAFSGDLLASLCKRKFGIKDFGKILPGHGGILDRFDSLVFASLFLFILTVMNYI